MENTEYQKDLEKLIDILPPKIAWSVKEKKRENIVEVVLDLGRYPEIRYLDGHVEQISKDRVVQADLDFTVSKIDKFTDDNRSGIPGTLHRISAIKNRKGNVIGLTCRIGRVVTGTIDSIRDLIALGKSILFLGRPGIGKTTKLREITRLLADEMGKRVIVVDTSNEIAGDGDVPHPAIGSARRMQVSSPEKQKDVMIEAVENHNPEVIVVDEIGTEKEAMAARTIAERGVMLVATAHGIKLENLIKNPTLADLVGGVKSVTLSDEEAKRRTTQKTVLEREKQPTFDILIEITDRDTLSIYPDVSQAVDYILRGWPVNPQIRKTGIGGSVTITEIEAPAKYEPDVPQKTLYDMYDKYLTPDANVKKIYIYAVSRSIVDKIIERLGISAEITRNINEADFVIAHKSYSKAGSKIISTAKSYALPIHFVKSNTMPQIQKVIKDALEHKRQPGDEAYEEYFDETEEALNEAQTAINKVLSGIPEIELEPRKQHIRKLQHELAEKYELQSTSIGDEPERRVCIRDKNILKNVG